MKTKTLPRMCTKLPRMWANGGKFCATTALITPYVGQSGAFRSVRYPVCVHLLIYQGGTPTDLHRPSIKNSRVAHELSARGHQK